jgi:carboxypeptidase Taq
LTVQDVEAAAPPELPRLRRLLGEQADLRHAQTVLGWDSRVGMPPRGSAARAEISATLGRRLHERAASDELGSILEELRSYEDSLDRESDTAALIRVARRDWERKRRVPPELVGEQHRSNGLALAAWDLAKAASDFAAFEPHIERQLELKRRYIECFDPPEHPYDVLLEEYEEGMTAAQVEEIFGELKRALVPLMADAPERGGGPRLAGPFPIEAQQQASRLVLDAFGVGEDAWRLDKTTHPFACSPGHGDVRLTTHYDDGNLHSLFSTMHEFGHGVYEWGVDPAFARTPLAHGTSSAVHESQSRTWENLVGRSRGFWRWFYPQLQPLFPERLGGVEEEEFVRASNAVDPGAVRIDADEVSYNLHIVLRFEIEQELLEERLAVHDVREAWNARVSEYLGVDVPDDARGVLQDMHWAAGLIGYFPTYTLGNVISVQFWQRARADLGDLEGTFERGEFGTLRDWLREHVYRHGRKFPPRELVRRVTGSDIDAGPYIGYLRTKFS